MKNATDSALCAILGIGCKTGTLFTSPDTHFGNGSNTNRESAAVDAQYGTNATWDYYKNTFGRNGIFGTGAGSYNRVHYGKNYVNAFWDGTKMTYGDGNGTTYGPLTSLDVAGHEMTHGVTENTAGLTYSGESGGLNEATSDIFGSMVEFSAANSQDPGDYLIGEEFDLAAAPRPAPDGQPGVGRRLAELLVDQCQERRRALLVGHRQPLLLPARRGVGREDDRWCPAQLDDVQRLVGDRHRPRVAANIWYRALTVYMTSGTNYAGARTATLNAARDLYGAGSCSRTPWPPPGARSASADLQSPGPVLRPARVRGT